MLSPHQPLCGELPPLDDIIGWDVGDWSKCLAYWRAWLSTIGSTTRKVLTIGERNGGLSLWFASLGCEVICTDYRPLSEGVRQLHSKWHVQQRISYATADVFDLAYPDEHFDVVACKSVIGGLSLDDNDRTTRTLENQKVAVEQIRRVLRPGGIFCGAENLTGTSVHMALRKMRLKGRLGWRYLTLSEVRWLFDGYSETEQKPYGFLGTHWPKSCGMNSLCAALDCGLSKILPGDWLYISFIRARK